MSSIVQTLSQQMEKSDQFKKWTVVSWTSKTEDHQYSTSCSHKDYTTDLYCLESIQRIRNCESHHNNKETASTIQTNGRDVIACHQDRARRERKSNSWNIWVPTSEMLFKRWNVSWHQAHWYMKMMWIEPGLGANQIDFANFPGKQITDWGEQFM